MLKGWKTYKIENLAQDIAMGPFGSNIKRDNFVESGVPVIRGGNLNEGRFKDKDFVYLTEEKATSLKRSVASPNELVFTHRGTIGQVGIIPENSYPRYVVSQSQMRLALNLSLADPYFMFYFFRSDVGQREWLKNSSQVGVPAIAQPTASLKGCEIDLPPLQEQRAIASILSALDDKIELNLQMNKTLEDKALVLYKHWFVDFGPLQSGEFVDSELGMIPKGWEIGRIDEFGKVVCGKTPSKKDLANYSSHNGYPFIKIPDMHGKVFVMEGSEMISDKGNKTQLNKLLPTGCVNVSCIATVGLVTINVFPSHTNQQINSIKPKKESLKYYIYLSMLNMKERFMNEASGGSATLNMNTSTFSGIELLKPPADYIIQFHSLVTSWYDKILQNQIQNQTLTTLRDTLLPKLISGEVRVKDIKQTIAQVL
jgi:type I restriction enzyme S subunit